MTYRSTSNKEPKGFTIINYGVQPIQDKNMAISKESKITINFGMDDKHVPEKITWQSTDDPGHSGINEAKGMLLSFFSEKDLDTVKIDLWTKDMKIDEMNLFMFQTLASLSDTFFNSTKNTELANEMRSFVHHFGISTKVLVEDENKG